MTTSIAEYGFSLAIAFLLGCMATGLLVFMLRSRSAKERDLFEEERLKLVVSDLQTALRGEQRKCEELDSACQRLSEQLNAPTQPVIAGSAEDVEKLKHEVDNITEALHLAQAEKESDRTRFASLLVKKNTTIDGLRAQVERLNAALSNQHHDATARSTQHRDTHAHQSPAQRVHTEAAADHTQPTA
ncbi:MAG: hypothetical protein AAF499_10870 [Pseudomonadota bacterium]